MFPVSSNITTAVEMAWVTDAENAAACRVATSGGDTDPISVTK
jgi:hypothetical protein